MAGWAASLSSKMASNIGLTQIDSGDMPDNVTIQTSPANNTVAANFTLFGQNAINLPPSISVDST